MDEKRNEVALAMATVARIDAMPILLRLASRISGSSVALVAQIDDELWTTCSAENGVNLSAEPGESLGVGVPARMAQKQTEMPVEYCLQCCVTAPVVLADGRRFGMLCALDADAALGQESRIAPIFNDLADLISMQINQSELRDRERAAFLDERAVGQLREQFVAILGHDLRNPLQAIAIGSETLARRLSDPWGSSIASRMKANARRMALLIDDVLDFTRARLGGGIEVDLTEVENLNGGLATVVQELRDAEPGCEIISSISVGRSVRCDLGRIQQVASNLLGNALTHGQPNSPIKLTARADLDDLVLEVWNDGEAIPPESLSKIFEPFWRHSVSGSRNGLGLGLHICSQIVRAHGGRISVKSTQEHGTQFTVRLPLTPLPAAEADSIPISAQSAG